MTSAYPPEVVSPRTTEQHNKTASSPQRKDESTSITSKTDDLYTSHLPSSSTAGFFQAPPHVLNQYNDDVALRRGLNLFASSEVQHSINDDLSSFGDRVLNRQTLGWVLDAERNLPYVRSWDTWGKRRDELITSEGWRNLQQVGIEEGIVAIPYENKHQEYSRVHWCAKYVLWCGSSAWVNCPSLMVDGVASLFRKHLVTGSLGDEKVVLRDAYERLISRDASRAWTTGQWMTERQGGSDVSMTETLATKLADNPVAYDAHNNELGPWRLDGFKWFSSATDANMMVLLGRTSKGISLFYAPMRKVLERNDILGHTSELNGVYIQRLKNKLGTKALPTAELELKGVRAWMVGEEARGTKEIATVLNVARIHNGITAIGFWGRGLGIVRAFVRVRVVGRRPLWTRTSFMRGVARLHVQYRADALFNFFVCALLGSVEQEPIASYHGQKSPTTKTVGQLPGVKDTMMAEWLFRLLAPALKGHCSKTAIAGLQECMECMGGVGYLENDDMQFNIARLYRDSNVLPIWEGTTDIMAEDSIIRALCGKNKTEVFSALSTWVTTLLQRTVNFPEENQVVKTWWDNFATLIRGNVSKDEIEMQSRVIMERLVDIVEGLLLLVDAQSDGDEVAGLVVKAWFQGKVDDKSSLRLKTGWKEQAESDMRIVFGDSLSRGVQARL